VGGRFASANPWVECVEMSQEIAALQRHGVNGQALGSAVGFNFVTKLVGERRRIAKTGTPAEAVTFGPLKGSTR
jgi:hypothetical protein